MGLSLEEGLRRLAEEPDVAALVNPRLDEIESLLTRYINEIELFNPAYGLVAVKSREELVSRHILDSLAPLGIIAGLLEETGRTLEAGGSRTPQIADLGSGAGLPGIPLAIALPGARFTLIERMGRRAGFLRNSIAVLALDNVEVEETEMERAGPGRFDLACFRAFRPLEAPLLKAMFRLLAPGGVLAAYKGRRKAVEAEINAAWAGPWDCRPCPVPGLDEERHLLTLRG
ncbi:MAG: 16S rRNA (guanine(527)-N(7))-methyltransferase RsmG, partial [Treponema sp.]|nr:16S rRNA (guanine(527)-N(7))-methyltransferase RsmG [Treponema sp.]